MEPSGVAGVQRKILLFVKSCLGEKEYDSLRAEAADDASDAAWFSVSELCGHDTAEQRTLSSVR